MLSRDRDLKLQKHFFVFASVFSLPHTRFNIISSLQLHQIKRLLALFRWEISLFWSNFRERNARFIELNYFYSFKILCCWERVEWFETSSIKWPSWWKFAVISFYWVFCDFFKCIPPTKTANLMDIRDSSEQISWFFQLLWVFVLFFKWPNREKSHLTQIHSLECFFYNIQIKPSKVIALSSTRSTLVRYLSKL